MTVHIIGIDCATEAKRVGLAMGTWDDGHTTVRAVQTGGKSQESLDATIAGWIRNASGPVLLALDAPLGWPGGMRDALEAHKAGDTIRTKDDLMFRRDTDREIKRTLGKTSLNVGADRIARTAHAALALLGRMRQLVDDPIPLAWTHTALSKYSAIEVYPAATLEAHGLDIAGYKKPDGDHERRKLLEGLRAKLADRLTLPPEQDEMLASADALDAMLCVVAATDFLNGKAMPPDTMMLSAHLEGWIWACRPLNTRSERENDRPRA